MQTTQPKRNRIWRISFNEKAEGGPARGRWWPRPRVTNWREYYRGCRHCATAAGAGIDKSYMPLSQKKQRGLAEILQGCPAADAEDLKAGFNRAAKASWRSASVMYRLERAVHAHLKLAFEEFEHGFTYRRMRAGESEQRVMWKVGRVTLWPNGFFLGHHFEWRLPIDDENTLSVLWVFSRVPKEQEPYVQERIPSWYGPTKDSATGRWITSPVANQDFVAWVDQGTITDRTQEKLGQSDKGVVMMRRRFFEELDAMQADPGFEPKGLIRDPARNHRIELPSACRDELLHGLPREQLAVHPLLEPYLKDFFGQAGQPLAVQHAYEAAIGQKVQGARFFKVHGSGSRAASETKQAATA